MMLNKNLLFEICIHKVQLSIPEVVTILGISTYKAYKLIRSNQLHAYRSPGEKCWHIPAWAIKEYLQKQADSKNS